jgi:2-polyprenyl-3-methyl-5-hydroxy-6-metoxy-1,4-benzoquinol methylase
MELPRIVESLFPFSKVRSRSGPRSSTRSGPGKRSKADQANPWAVKKQNAAEKAERNCPVCCGSGPKAEAYRVTAPSDPGETLLIRHCLDCRSYFYDPIDLAEYGAEALMASLDFYVESVGAPRFICQLLSRLPRRKSPRLLEIGSGYGLLLDVWQTQFGGTGVGVEPSPLAAAGMKDLGVNIVRQFLKPGLELPGGEEGFDHVVAVEIIEHVADPLAFAKTAVSHLHETGVLVLTTPNAKLLEDEHAAPHELWSALSPGKHTLLFNEDSLESLLRKAGLTHFYFRTTASQIVCYASRHPFELRDADATTVEQVHEQHLRLRVRSAPETSALRRGMAFRLLETLVHRGDFAAAMEVWRSLEQALMAAFGPEVLDPKEQLRRVKRGRKAAELRGKVPTFIAALEYLLGLIALLHLGERKMARRHFHQAHLLAVRLLPGDDVIYPLVAPVVWQARFEEANTMLAEGGDRLAEGMKLMEKIAASGQERQRDYALVPAPAPLCTRAHVERLKVFVFRNEWEAARRELEALESTCATLKLRLPQGPGELVASIVTNGLGSAVPAEPLWYLYARGKVDETTPDQWTTGLDHFRQLGRACDLLAGQTPVADVFRQESRFCQAELCVRLGLKTEAQQLYTNLAALEPAARPELERARHWATLARERLAETAVATAIDGSSDPGSGMIEPQTSRLFDYQAGALQAEGAHVQIETTWSDDQFVGISGFVLVQTGLPEDVQIVYEGATLLDIQWHDRPDVYEHEVFASYTRQPRCGFRARYQRRAVHPLAVRMRSGPDAPDFQRLHLAATGFPPLPPAVPPGLTLAEFAGRVNRECRNVMEIGSRVVCPDSASKRRFFQPHVQYTGFDYYPDANTDVTGDAHRLSSYFPEGTTFDAIFSLSVLEHIAMPWVVAMEINKLLPVGGLAYHSTVFTWPLHESPWDFWRFSHEGLRVLFSPALGFEVITLGMTGPCRMHMEGVLDANIGQSPAHPNYAESNILVRKVRDINPDDFRWNASIAQVLPEQSFYPAPA